MVRAAVLSVIGAGDAPSAVCAAARELGREIASRGAVLINGARGGVMRAAAQGAREAGGHTVGVLPGYDRRDANEFIEFAVATGMGEARNAIIVASSDAVIALPGEGGTLAEIGFAKKFRRPVVALDCWPEIDGLHRAQSAREAVELALRLARAKIRKRSGRDGN
jgi:uncharacterized protein (TIGR00725 family)